MRFDTQSATRSLAGLVLLVAASPTAAQTADWTTGPGGNAARDCLSSEIGPTDPQILWQGGLPAIVSQQAAIEGNVVVMPRIANFTIPTGTSIVAYDLHTGVELWTTQLPFTLPDEWRSRTSGIRDGQVYATRAGNTNLAPLYALDVADGSIIWESEDLIDESTTEGVSFADDGDLIVGNFSSVMRIDRNDGSTVWSTPRSCPTTNGCLVSVFGDRGYYWQASAAGPKVTAINITTGAVLYSSDGIGGGFIEQLGLLVGPDGTIYAPRTQNNPISDFFVALEDTGSALVEKWSVPMGYTPFATMGVDPRGRPYTFETDNDAGLFTVLQLDPANGNVLASSDPLPFDFPSEPRMAIDAAGKIFLTNGSFGQGRLFSFNPDLTLRWSVPLSGVNLGGPALGEDGILIVCGTGTNIRAYQTEPPCPADLDGDGAVGASDLAILLGNWGPNPGHPADFNGDDIVSAADLAELLGDWGPCP